jgi:RNA polymerase sigma-70 factor (ECF subfamily)
MLCSSHQTRYECKGKTSGTDTLPIWHPCQLLSWQSQAEHLVITDVDEHVELETLFRAGLAQDQRAYARFLHRITPILRRMAAPKCAACDVDDVVQEILISIHKVRHTYDGQRPVMPWLTSIAKFRIADHLRKHYTQRRDKTIDIQGLEEILPDVTQSGADGESIDELLKDVPESQRRILTLMHVERFTAREVGVQMNMNESAVKVAAHRALKKIREKFSS